MASCRSLPPQKIVPSANISSFPLTKLLTMQSSRFVFVKEPVGIPVRARFPYAFKDRLEQRSTLLMGWEHVDRVYRGEMTQQEQDEYVAALNAGSRAESEDLSPTMEFYDLFNGPLTPLPSNMLSDSDSESDTGASPAPVVMEFVPTAPSPSPSDSLFESDAEDTGSDGSDVGDIVTAPSSPTPAILKPASPTPSFLAPDVDVASDVDQLESARSSPTRVALFLPSGVASDVDELESACSSPTPVTLGPASPTDSLFSTDVNTSAVDSDVDELDSDSSQSPARSEMSMELRRIMSSPDHSVASMDLELEYPPTPEGSMELGYPPSPETRMEVDNLLPPSPAFDMSDFMGSPSTPGLVHSADTSLDVDELSIRVRRRRPID
ncbi:hypothetical protein R3P38DRAFT_894250 [Favolaschia claudopus]|uniref:Uncharacterized protein n=1 Tax=Favolaschia claudopus TaxID=2862362 RepID=A0AAV9ZVP8_9AGAR